MIPAIHADLGLDQKGVSILTGLPILLLALAAVPGSLLIARLGARRALVAGLLTIGIGSALRGAGASLAVLYVATLVMGVGVAVSQPVFPTLVRQWFPARVAPATAVYANGLLAGETVPAAFTGPWVAPMLGGGWPATFAAWSAPAFLAAALVLLLTVEVSRDSLGLPRRWWPDFRSRQLWQVGLVMGFASAAYFGANAFIPDFVHAAGHPELKDPALGFLNASQLLSPAVMLGPGRRLVGRRWPFVLTGATLAAAGSAIVLTPATLIVAWAGVMGLSSALALVLTLALPPLLVAGEDVPRFSAGMFLIMYLSSFVGPLAGGAAWDATGNPGAAFWALAAGGGLMSVLATTTPLRRVEP